MIDKKQKGRGKKMKLLQKMKQKKTDNKGFSLVELIIVIAIMAILVGIVGTQVVPYIEKSKESKDLQLVNSYSTAAMTAYSENAGKLKTTGTITIAVYTGTYTGGSDLEKDQTLLQTEIKRLVGYSGIDDLKAKMTSKTGKNSITDITITIDPASHTMTTTATGTTLEVVNADL